MGSPPEDAFPEEDARTGRRRGMAGRPAAGHGRRPGYGQVSPVVVGGEEEKGKFLFLEIFRFFNWADMWSPCTPQQITLYFYHVIPIGGPEMSEIMSIHI
jgi:hypothetical protein